MSAGPRSPRDIVEHVLRLNDVTDPHEVAQEVVNAFTDVEVAHFALYRGYDCERWPELPPDMADELAAMRAIARALEPLDQASRDRILLSVWRDLGSSASARTRHVLDELVEGDEYRSQTEG